MLYQLNNFISDELIYKQLIFQKCYNHMVQILYIQKVYYIIKLFDHNFFHNTIMITIRVI